MSAPPPSICPPLASPNKYQVGLALWEDPSGPLGTSPRADGCCSLHTSGKALCAPQGAVVLKGCLMLFASYLGHIVTQSSEPGVQGWSPYMNRGAGGMESTLI